MFFRIVMLSSVNKKYYHVTCETNVSIIIIFLYKNEIIF